MDLRKEKKSSRTKKNGTNGNSKAGRKNGQLTTKQKLFVEEYLKDFNATRAAGAVGYAKDKSNASLRSIACRLLKNVNIMTQIDKRFNERSKKLQIEEKDIITELKKIAFVDIRGFFNDDGTLKEEHELNSAQVSAINYMNIDKNYVGRGDNRKLVGYKMKIKFNDRLKALELLARHLGMFKTK